MISSCRTRDYAQSRHRCDSHVSQAAGLPDTSDVDKFAARLLTFSGFVDYPVLIRRNAMSDTRLVIRALGFLTLLLSAFISSPVGFTQDGESASTSPFAGLRFREIGPASPAGRIDDFAVLESNPAISTSRQLLAVCGRPSIKGQLLQPCLTMSRLHQSATSLLRQPTQTSFG